MLRISVVTSMYRCNQYLDAFFDAVERIENKDECEFILVFNDPTEEEYKKVSQRIEGKPYFRYVVVEREPLYASWNRGARLAKARYVANWNVDDVRLPDSLKRQADALDSNPECAIAYGDTVSVQNYGDTTGRLNCELDYSKETAEQFKNSFFMSCFPMWRKSIHEEIGYFDEQFRLVGDFEFQIRAAFKYPFVKTEGILGYFLSGGGGTRLSQQIARHTIEDNATYLRYGVYEKVNICYLSSRSTFKENEIKNGEEWISLDRFIPEITEKRKSERTKWIPNVFKRFPIDLLRYVKVNIFRIPTRTS